MCLAKEINVRDFRTRQEVNEMFSSLLPPRKMNQGNENRTSHVWSFVSCDVFDYHRRLLSNAIAAERDVFRVSELVCLLFPSHTHIFSPLARARSGEDLALFLSMTHPHHPRGKSMITYLGSSLYIDSHYSLRTIHHPPSTEQETTGISHFPEINLMLDLSTIGL